MKYTLLNRTHADFDLDAITRNDDLFTGGDAFRSRVARYLPQNEMEPAPAYKRRCARACYLNYIARIVRYFAAALFSKPLTYNADPSPDIWYAEDFKEDADGKGTDFGVVLSEAFTRALVNRRAYVRIEAPKPDAKAPPPDSLAEADRSGLRRIRVCHVPTSAVRNWRRNPDGSLAWVMEYDKTVELLDPTDTATTTTETWTAWFDDGTARRWQTVYTAAKPRPMDVPEVEAPFNPTGRIPLIELALPSELALVAHVVDAQLEHFRKYNALGYSVDRTCYAMPWFSLKDKRKPPVMGTGYYGMLGVGESVTWPCPPSTPYEVIDNIAKGLVQEIHRVVEQMALAVDNNAAAAVGRSSESKQSDGQATSIVLPHFGIHVREFAENILESVSAARGDDIAWSVDGMESFDVVDVAVVIATATGAKALDLGSKTFDAENGKRVAAAVLPSIDEKTRAKIIDEITEHANRPTTIPPPMPVASPPVLDDDGKPLGVPPPPRLPTNVQPPAQV